MPPSAARALAVTRPSGSMVYTPLDIAVGPSRLMTPLHPFGAASTLAKVGLSVGALVGITGMKQLELAHTRIDDGAVDHLLKFRNAEYFRLTRGPGGISDKAIGRFRTDLRACVLEFSEAESPKQRPAGGGK